MILKKFILCLLALFLCQSYAYANSRLDIPGVGNLSIKSFREGQFDGVIRQQLDYSCGSGALASLLHFHYNRPVQELEVMKAMYEKGDKAKIEKEGFSLLDMKKYLQTIGLKANGYKVTLDSLAKENVPVIALINMNGYLHFVVIKGISNDLVLIGDPAIGRRVVAKSDFEDMWQDRIVFVVEDEMSLARQNFNKASEWKRYGFAQYAPALSNQFLSNLTIAIVPTPNYYNF